MVNGPVVRSQWSSLIDYFIEEEKLTPAMLVQRDCCEVLRPFFTGDGLVNNSLKFAESLVSIMMTS